MILARLSSSWLELARLVPLTIEESVHCECSIAMHIRSLLVDKNFTNTPHIKIGVS
ncbi:hypothetical protein BDZ91DRAFT_734492, partial [Kalaharituber pfeilii]